MPRSRSLFDVATGTVRLAFQPGQQFVQGRGVVQCGIVGMMLDFATAFAALRGCPTTNGGNSLDDHRLLFRNPRRAADRCW